MPTNADIRELFLLLWPSSSLLWTAHACTHAGLHMSYTEIGNDRCVLHQRDCNNDDVTYANSDTV
jgi:hypothetical protein